jgi:hypothetical protein
MPTSESPMLATVLRGWCFLHLVLDCTIVILKKCFVLVELIQVIFTVIYNMLFLRQRSVFWCFDFNTAKCKCAIDFTEVLTLGMTCPVSSN